MLNYHRERFRKLTFRALALRQSEGLTHLSTRLIKPNFCFSGTSLVRNRNTSPIQNTLKCLFRFRNEGNIILFILLPIEE